MTHCLVRHDSLLPCETWLTHCLETFSHVRHWDIVRQDSLPRKTWLVALCDMIHCRRVRHDSLIAWRHSHMWLTSETLRRWDAETLRRWDVETLRRRDIATFSQVRHWDISRKWDIVRHTLQHTATHCNTLQHTFLASETSWDMTQCLVRHDSVPCETWLNHCLATFSQRPTQEACPRREGLITMVY